MGLAPGQPPLSVWPLGLNDPITKAGVADFTAESDCENYMGNRKGLPRCLEQNAQVSICRNEFSGAGGLQRAQGAKHALLM